MRLFKGYYTATLPQSTQRGAVNLNAMANGPPTPPPTSATELQDEARSQAPSNTVQPVSTPRAAPQAIQSRQLSDVYHRVLHKLANLAGHNDYQALVRLAEKTDLNVRSILW